MILCTPACLIKKTLVRVTFLYDPQPLRRQQELPHETGSTNILETWNFHVSLRVVYKHSYEPHTIDELWNGDFFFLQILDFTYLGSCFHLLKTGCLGSQASFMTKFVSTAFLGLFRSDQNCHVHCVSVVQFEWLREHLAAAFGFFLAKSYTRRRNVSPQLSLVYAGKLRREVLQAPVVTASKYLVQTVNCTIHVCGLTCESASQRTVVFSCPQRCNVRRAIGTVLIIT